MNVFDRLERAVASFGTPQVQLLTKVLTEHGSISNAEAFSVYRIGALPRRIADLKSLINTMRIPVRVKHTWKRDATNRRYVRYTLETLA